MRTWTAPSARSKWSFPDNSRAPRYGPRTAITPRPTPRPPARSPSLDLHARLPVAIGEGLSPEAMAQSLSALAHRNLLGSARRQDVARRVPRLRVAPPRRVAAFS